MIRSFKELVREAKHKKGIVVGVPSPEDDSSALTVIRARRQGLADFVLCGDREKTERLLRQHGGRPADFEIVSAASQEQAAAHVVELARQRKIQVILKGFLPTAALMKPILDKEHGLRTGQLLSDILVVENPADNYRGLLGMSDGGLNILPDLAQKKQIVENAVRAFHKLGYSLPRVGVLAAIETVKESMPATLDARDLTAMNQRGEIGGCQVYGPLALDIAVSPEAARHKGIDQPLAGQAQILIVPNIEAGNILGKAFTYYLKIPVAHVIMGAAIPVLIPSRNESENDKFYSVALGVVIAES